ncbi:MAG: DNA polymerase I [Neisseriales bacterium]|nr:MAG: DNA polymerase I [Neisseriales bacterium]
MNKTMLLIDGSSFIFRAFYAVKNLSSPSGIPTNATYGVINMLKQMEKKYPTAHWVCVFDAKGKTFRDDIYPEYKATRRETPAELVTQIPYIHDIIEKLGIPVIVEDGVEADDVIATIAKKYAREGYGILIATGDKDFAQVVDDKITLVNTMTGEILDVAGVEAKFGVRPDQIIDYLSLIGDTVDNVPGVHKCGPKTAQKWLNEFGSIDALIANQDKLTGAVGDNFRNTIDWLPTAKRLITIDDRVDVKHVDINNLTNLTRKEPRHHELIPIFRELNFRTWLKESEFALTNNLQGELIGSTTDNLSNKQEFKSKTLHVFNRAGGISELIQKIISDNRLTSYSLITSDYTDILSQLMAVIITDDENIYLLELATENNQNNELFLSDPTDFSSLLLPYFMADCPKICINLKNNLKTLARHLDHINGIDGDIALASYIRESQQNQSLSAILERYGQTQGSIDGFETVCGKGAKRLLWHELDSTQKNHLAKSLNEELLSAYSAIIQEMDSKEQDLYRNIELPLSIILDKIEKAGMKIDLTAFQLLKGELQQKIRSLEELVFQEAGCVFNLNSPKQLQDVLFNQLKLPTDGIKSNTTGYSTDEESLSILADQGIGIANLILEFRTLSKLLNTYVDKLPQAADSHERLHTTLEQTVVASGRLSSKDPNLQNIPVRTEYGQKIRKCFIAESGHQLVCADYSQIELRILAHISNDANLIDAFNKRYDIHLATASQIFHKPQSEVTRDERSYAKSINFGLIYGKSVFGLAKELKIERSAAKLYIDNYFAKYPQVKGFMDRIKKDAHRDGYVSTIYGRKIYLANINSSNKILSQAEERLALNAPMQGSAADIIKIAMLNVDKWLQEKKLHSRMIMQVHDELILQVPDNEVSIVLENLAQLMIEGVNLNVPLEVDVKAASNWSAAH